MTVTSMTEDEARQYIESVIWPNGPVCPHCNANRAWNIQEGTARAGVYKCSRCGKQFTVKPLEPLWKVHISPLDSG